VNSGAEARSFSRARTLLKKVASNGGASPKEEGEEGKEEDLNENGNDLRRKSIESSKPKKETLSSSSSAAAAAASADDGTSSTLPIARQPRPSNVTSLFGRGKSKRPDHMKLALWWRVDLLEKNTTEERLSIQLHRPHTARQQLGIDIYEARGIFKTLQIRTVEGLAL
jgi:hypothetical protein